MEGWSTIRDLGTNILAGNFADFLNRFTLIFFYKHTSETTYGRYA